MSKKLAFEFENCINTFHLRLHNERLETKPHTTYCIIKRFSEYINGEITQIGNVFLCKSNFGCDFIDHQFPHMLSDSDYKRLINEPCTFEMDFWNGFNGTVLSKVMEIQKHIVYSVGNSMWQIHDHKK